MAMQYGCCCDLPEDCFGCVSESVPTTITFQGGTSAWSWLMPTSPHTCTENVKTRSSPFCSGSFLDTTTTWETRSLDISRLNGSHTMAKHPDSDVCGWRYTDLRIVDNYCYIGGTACSGGFGILSDYAYVDSPPITGVFGPPGIPALSASYLQCGVLSGCSTTQFCRVGMYGMVVYLAVQSLTESSAGVFTFDPMTSTPHWVLSVSAQYSRAAKNAPGGTTTGTLDHCGDIGGAFAHGGGCSAVPLVDLDLSTGHTACPPYRYTTTGVSGPGGGMAHYVAEIDCDNDFSGSTVTLPLATSVLGVNYANRRTGFDVTAPASVGIVI